MGSRLDRPYKTMTHVGTVSRPGSIRGEGPGRLAGLPLAGPSLVLGSVGRSPSSSISTTSSDDCGFSAGWTVPVSRPRLSCQKAMDSSRSSKRWNGSLAGGHREWSGDSGCHRSRCSGSRAQTLNGRIDVGWRMATSADNCIASTSRNHPPKSIERDINTTPSLEPLAGAENRAPPTQLDRITFQCGMKGKEPLAERIAAVARQFFA